MSIAEQAGLCISLSETIEARFSHDGAQICVFVKESSVQSFDEVSELNTNIVVNALEFLN